MFSLTSKKLNYITFSLIIIIILGLFNLNLAVGNFLSNKFDNLNFLQDKSIENLSLSQENNKIQNFLNLNLKKVLENIQTLNVTEHSINSVLLLGQRSMPLNLSLKNDSSNILPIPIDTASLSLILSQLTQKYPENTNMTITIYEDPKTCQVPVLEMAIDGVYLNFQVGIIFSVFNSETLEYDVVLNTVMSMEVKLTIYTKENKLNFFILKINVKDTDIVSNSLEISKDELLSKFRGFMSVMIDQSRKMTTQIDVLQKLNEFSGLNFTLFEVIVNIGNLVLNIQ